MIETLKAFFMKSQDRCIHFFDITHSPYDSPIKGHPRTFGKPAYQIHVLDSFADKRPVIFNYDFLSSESPYEIRFAITFLLDSQLVSALHEYRIARDRLEVDRRNAVHDFLIYASNLRYDFNPMFYFLESLHKAAPGTFLQVVTPAAVSLLHLHSMDEIRFLKTGEIHLKPDAVDHYCGFYGAPDLEECGRAAAELFLRNSRSDELICQRRSKTDPPPPK